MMLVLAFLVSGLSLMIWIVLLVARGGFWRGCPRGRCRRGARRGGRGRLAGRRRGRAGAQRGRRDRPGGDFAARAGLPGRLSSDHCRRPHDDGTADAARAAALAINRADRLTVLAAKPLPAGWSGKVWAQSQGIAAVQTLGLPADYLLLTDADIGHPPDAVAQLVTRAQAENRDLVSLMVRLRCDSFWEKALIPAFVFFFAKLYRSRGSTTRATGRPARRVAACSSSARRSRKRAASSRSAAR